jgi:hypothetical protein
MMVRSFFSSSRLALSGVILLSVSAEACGGNGSGPGGTNAGGSSSSEAGRSAGGSMASGGGSPSAGGTVAAGAGSGGSSAGSGGTSSGASGAALEGGSGGASVEPGGPCTAHCPTGKVHACFDHCPLGACDDAGLYAPKLCSSVYPSAIDSQTTYCEKGQSTNYCLTTIDGDIHYYQVSCSNGSPTVTLCVGGCGVDSTGTAACGPA